MDELIRTFPKGFEAKAMELYSRAVTIAVARGHEHIDTYHYLLAWLVDSKLTPVGVSAAKYDTALDYLVQRLPPIVSPDKTFILPKLANVLQLAIEDSRQLTENRHQVEYRWIIPNLLDGRRIAAQVIGIMGIDVVQFLLATLDLLKEPFPSLSSLYLGRLNLDVCNREMAFLLHRRAE
jgi:ATP-dependent Clp protease ATP-binding subunit ClpA